MVTRAPTPLDLAQEAGLVGIWLIARKPIGRRYPCRCRLGKTCDPKWCWCSGRVDVDDAPAHCCARINMPAVAAAAQRAP